MAIAVPSSAPARVAPGNSQNSTETSRRTLLSSFAMLPLAGSIPSGSVAIDRADDSYRNVYKALLAAQRAQIHRDLPPMPNAPSDDSEHARLDYGAEMIRWQCEALAVFQRHIFRAAA